MDCSIIELIDDVISNLLKGSSLIGLLWFLQRGLLRLKDGWPLDLLRAAGNRLSWSLRSKRAWLLYIIIRLLEELSHLLVWLSWRDKASLELLHKEESILYGLDDCLGSVDLHIGHSFFIRGEEVLDLVIGGDYENSVKQWDCSSLDLSTASILVSPDLEVMAELIGVAGILVEVFDDDDLLSLVSVEPLAACHDEWLLTKHLDGLLSGCM